MLNAFRYERWGDAGEGISRFFFCLVIGREEMKVMLKICNRNCKGIK